MENSQRLDHLLLLGLGGANKIMSGEFSRLIRRGLSGERSREVLSPRIQKLGPGGLMIPFSPDVAALSVMYHRTSARVLWGLAECRADRLEPLYDELCEILTSDDRPWWPQKATISVLAFGTRSIEAGERQVVGVVKNALLRAAEQRGVEFSVDSQRPDLLFFARSLPDEEGRPRLLVGLDLAGRPMHQRGYRTRSSEAPLREDLAANLVMLSRYDGRSEVLIDPMAGSGTLLIEGALMAAGRPVWMSGRQPLATKIPCLKEEFRGLSEPLFADTRPQIFAAERDAHTYDVLERALMTSGTSEQTTTFCGDFRNWQLSRQLEGGPRGVILSNPPYGARLETPLGELRSLYRDLGDWCSDFVGYRAGFIVGEPEPNPEKRRGPSIVRVFQEAFGRAPRIKKPLSNGPLRAQFLLYDL